MLNRLLSTTTRGGASSTRKFADATARRAHERKMRDLALRKTWATQYARVVAEQRAEAAKREQETAAREAARVARLQEARAKRRAERSASAKLAREAQQTTTQDHRDVSRAILRARDEVRAAARQEMLEALAKTTSLWNETPDELELRRYAPFSHDVDAARLKRH